MRETHLLVKEQILYYDLLDNEHKTRKEAEEANHSIHLKFRKYLDSLLVTFDDGRLDKMKTTKNLWDKLTFTKESISSGCLNIDMKTLFEDVRGRIK